MILDIILLTKIERVFVIRSQGPRKCGSRCKISLEDLRLKGTFDHFNRGDSDMLWSDVLSSCFHAVITDYISSRQA